MEMSRKTIHLLVEMKQLVKKNVEVDAVVGIPKSLSTIEELKELEEVLRTDHDERNTLVINRTINCFAHLLEQGYFLGFEMIKFVTSNLVHAFVFRSHNVNILVVST